MQNCRSLGAALNGRHSTLSDAFDDAVLMRAVEIVRGPVDGRASIDGAADADGSVMSGERRGRAATQPLPEADGAAD